MENAFDLNAKVSEIDSWQRINVFGRYGVKFPVVHAKPYRSILLPDQDYRRRPRARRGLNDVGIEHSLDLRPDVLSLGRTDPPRVYVDGKRVACVDCVLCQGTMGHLLLLRGKTASMSEEYAL